MSQISNGLIEVNLSFQVKGRLLDIWRAKEMFLVAATSGNAEFDKLKYSPGIRSLILIYKWLCNIIEIQYKS